MSVERESWVERYPTALCANDSCPWKHVGTDLEATQRRGEDHVADTGHSVTVYRELRRRLTATSRKGPPTKTQ